MELLRGRWSIFCVLLKKITIVTTILFFVTAMKSIWPRILRFCFRFMKRKAMLFAIPSWRSFLGNMAFLVWMLQFSSYIWILIKHVSTFKSFGWLLHYVDILSSAVRSFVDERSVVIHICSREALNSWLARAAYSIFTFVSNLR